MGFGKLRGGSEALAVDGDGVHHHPRREMGRKAEMMTITFMKKNEDLEEQMKVARKLIAACELSHMK